MPHSSSQIESILATAVDLPTPAARQEYLAQACAGDTELQRQVEQMLEHHFQAGSFLQSPAPGLPSTISMPMETAGQKIGPYKLLEKLGEGGMGTVWKAQQSEPVKRLVALKLIKPGLDSVSVLRRFDAERQALALLSHHNIAKMLDAGTTETGRPYFVMELVKGVPITKYCDETHTSIEERLRLFILVCQAIQHAHQKGIIHRDIKPSNVLVCMEDGKSVPKVIDFGVAKALLSPLTEGTLHTALNQIVGTLEYMSPEQAELNALDIDTRADIYALGVLLFELLTGTTPLTREELKHVAVVGMLRKVKESQPKKPSTRLSESKEKIASLAALRRTEPTKLMKEVRGDLDWIVLKCLEADRTRRYETANAVAREIERHLANEPVEARAPSTNYRIKKFFVRNRWGVAAASLIMLSLVSGVLGLTWGLLRAEHHRVLAEQSAQAERDAKLVADTKRTEAENNLAFAKKGNEILGSVFSSLNPEEKYETLADLRNALKKNLENAVNQLEGSAIGDQLTVAEMQNTLGYSLLGLGEYAKAILLFQKSYATRIQQFGADHSATLVSMINLATGYMHAGKLDLALPLLEEALKLAKAKLGTHHTHTLTTMNNLAMGYMQAGKLNLALPLLEESLQLTKVKLGADDPSTFTSMNNLAMCYQFVGKRDLALQLSEETLKRRKAKLGADHPHTLQSMNNLAMCYKDAGKLDLALPLLVETVKRRKANLGVDHSNTFQSMGNLALGYQDAGKLDLALPLFEETLKVTKAKLSDDHPDTLKCINNLARAYHHAGKLDLALPLYEETIKLSKAKLGTDHPNTLICMNNLAIYYKEVGKLDLALPLLEETLKLTKAKYGADNTETLSTMSNLADLYREAGKIEIALPLLEETLKLQKAKLGSDHIETLSTMSNLARGYYFSDKLDLALPLLEETLKRRKEKQGADHPDTLGSMNDLALGYQDAGKLDLALSLFGEALKLQKAKLGADHPQTIRMMANLATCYQAAGKLDLACPQLEEALKLQKAKLGTDHPQTLTLMCTLASIYASLGRHEESTSLAKNAYEGSKATLGPEHNDTVVRMKTLGRSCYFTGKTDLSIPLFEEALRIESKNLGRDSIYSISTMGNLAVNYLAAGRAKEALQLAEEAWDRRQTHKTSSMWFDTLPAQVGRIYLRCNQWSKAESMLRLDLATRKNEQNREDLVSASTKAMLGQTLQKQKKFGEALPLLNAGYTGLRQFEIQIAQPMKWLIPETINSLIECCQATGKLEEASHWRAELEKAKTKLEPEKAKTKPEPTAPKK